MGNKQSVTSRIFQEIGNQRDTLILWAPVFFGAGIITFFNFPALASGGWAAYALPVTVLALGIWAAAVSYRRTGLPSRLWILIIGGAVLLFALGFCMAKWRFDSVGTVLLDKDLPAVMITGEINKIVVLEGGKAKRVVIDNPVIEDDRYKDIGLTSVKLRSYHFKGDEWQSGDIVRVRAKLMAPSAPVMPGGFDYRFHAYFNGISASGFTMGNAEMVKPDQAGRLTMQKMRDYIADRAYAGMNGRDDLAGIAVALLTGERAGIREDDNEAMRVSGLAHLIAISGLNIGLVAGIVFFAIRLFFAAFPYVALRYPIKKWAAVCAIIMAFLYTILAGLDVPVLRSFIMSAMVFLAIICDRSALNLRFFAFAAFIIMVMTPEAVLGASFQLSFSAVVALILYYQHQGRLLFSGGKGARNDASLWVRFAKKPVLYGIGIIMTTVVSTMATAPFSILHFNTFPVYGVISNMVAIPVTGAVVMPAGLLAVLTIPFGIDHWFWPMMGWGIELINTVAYWVASLPHASIYVAEFTSVSVFLICGGFVWFMIWNGMMRHAGVVMLCIGFAMTLTQGHKQVLISDDMRGILVVDTSVDKSVETMGSPYYLIGHINAYIRRNWLPYYGLSPDVDIPRLRDGDNINPAMGYCDSFMCSLTLDRVRIGVIFNPLTLSEACDRHDVVITRIPVAEKQQCPQAKVIDRFDVYWDGATIVTVKGGDYVIKTVHDRQYLPYPVTGLTKVRKYKD